MKKMRKLFALLMALSMIMALAVSANAAEITVKRDGITEDQTYNAYKIFDATTSDTNEDNKIDDSDAVSYTITTSSPWFQVVTGVDPSTLAGENVVPKVINANGLKFTPSSTTKGLYSVEEGDGFDAASFAKLLNRNKTDKPIAGTADKSSDYNIPNLATGYYFVDSTTGTLCSLATRDSVQDIVDKNKEPGIDKSVTAAQDGNAGNTSVDNNSDGTATNTVSVGDEFDYTVTIKVEPGAENYVFVDKMSAGLELQGTAPKSVSIDAANYTVERYNKAAADVTIAADKTVNGNIVIKFNQAYLDTITAETEVTIVYTVKVTSDAQTSVENTASLVYGHNYDVDKDDKVVSKLGTITFKKVANEAGGAGLPDAEFTIVDSEGNAVTVSEVTENTKGVYKMDPAGTATITSAADGTVTISGLRADTYTITETKAPEGYNQKLDPDTVKLNLKEDESGLEQAAALEIINQAGTILPSTGGIGTTIFTVVGATLMIGAAVLFITKKRSIN